MRKRCQAIDCNRPARSRGLCQAHYREAHRKAEKLKNPAHGPEYQVQKNGGSDLHFVNKNRRVRHVEDAAGNRVPVLYSKEGFAYVVQGGEIMRAVVGEKVGSEYQIAGVECSDCDRSGPVRWCDSERHPTFSGKWSPTVVEPRPRPRPPMPNGILLPQLRYCPACSSWAARAACATCGGEMTRERRPAPVRKKVAA